MLSLYCVLTEIKVQVYELNVDVVAAVVVFLLHSVECVGLGAKIEISFVTWPWNERNLFA